MSDLPNNSPNQEELNRDDTIRTINPRLLSDGEKTASAEEIRSPIKLSSIYGLMQSLDECSYADKWGVHTDKLVIISNTAISVFKASVEAQETGRLNFDEIFINPGDIDLFYTDMQLHDLSAVSAQNHYKSFIEKARKKLPWLEIDKSTGTALSQNGDLKHIPPGDFREPLSHIPISPFWYKGYLAIPERPTLEVEITDRLAYEYQNKAYSMRFNSSGYKTIEDEQGRQLTILNMAQTAVQKFAYGGRHLSKSLDAIKLHCLYGDGDFFSLINTAHQVCPYIAKDYVSFLLKNIQKLDLGYLGFENIFGSKAETALKITGLMLDTIDPNVYTYHNYLNHTVPMIFEAKEALETLPLGINEEYFDIVLLGINAHESGVQFDKPMQGHEARGAEKAVSLSEPVVGVLVEATKLERLNSKERNDLLGITSILPQEEEGFSIVPSVLLENKMSILKEKLSLNNIPEDQAEKMLYMMSLMDTLNILTVGNINKTLEVLIEDAISISRQGKSLNGERFVQKQMSLYVGLFKNLRDFISVKLNDDPKNKNFKEVFIPLFLNANKISDDDVYWDMYSGKYLDESKTYPDMNVYVKSKLSGIINEKIEIWEYIAEHGDDSLLKEYLKAITETSDPEARKLGITLFNQQASDLVTRAYLENTPKE